MIPNLGDDTDNGYYGIFEYCYDLEKVILDILDGVKRHDMEGDLALPSNRCDDIYEIYTRIKNYHKNLKIK